MTRETLMLRAQSLLPNLPQETLEFACDLVLEQICITAIWPRRRTV